MSLGEMIADLKSRYPIVDDPELKPLVNFSQNRRLPIHSWFDYKQGYSPELIERLATEAGLKSGDWVVDPFNGVGTTLVALNSRHINGVGFDVNPVANLAAKVKSQKLSQSDVDFLAEWNSSVDFEALAPAPAPAYKSLPRIFTDHQLTQLLQIKRAIDSVDDKRLRDFALLAYISIVEPVSNRVKDGNGIKISRTKKPIQDVFGAFKAQMTAMLFDLTSATFSTAEMQVIEKSLLEADDWVEKNRSTLSAAIFSPPYANCFDYLEVYKMELWMGGFVSEYSDFRQYRDASVRSHVNSSFSRNLRRQNDSAESVAHELEATELWNKNIPDMIRGYFDDMQEVLSRLNVVLAPGGSVFIVVANSSYRGVIVPTDLLLAKAAEEVGFAVRQIRKARSIRGSSQHMAQRHDNSDLMRESVIILKKE